MMDAKRIIAYWRDSLRDAELASLELTKDNHVRLSSNLLEKGQLDERQTAVLFSSHSKEDADTMPVIVAPIVASRGSRGYRRRNKALCPLLIPAELSKDGNLYSDGNMWIPRPLLEPTSSDFILGSVDALDNFWENNENSSNSWPETLNIGWRMLHHVTNGEGQLILKNAGYIESDSAAVIDASNLRGMSTNIIAVYDDLLTQKQLPPLFRKITNLQSPSPRHPLPMSSWLEPAKLHLGSFDNQFPLSPSQREALYHLFTLSKGTVLAVGGPPGTGKTTLLHSVIASLWVKAAMLEESPPVIVAASTNNQAVMNVIDSFSGIASIERWLPVDNLGLYLVNSKDKQAEAAKRGILVVNKFGDGFPQQIETFEFVDKAIDKYLAACSYYFRREITTVGQAVAEIHLRLVKKTKACSGMVETNFQRIETVKTLTEVQVEYTSLKARESALQEQLAKEDLTLEKDIVLRTSWLRYVQNEPTLYNLFNFISGIKRKRRARYQLFLDEYIPNADIDQEHTAISRYIDERVQSAKMTVNKVKKEILDVRRVVLSLKNLIYSYTEIGAKWENIRSQLTPEIEWDQLFLLENEDGTANKANLLNWLDTTLRHELFILATHYWEGRWLQEIEKDKIVSPQFKESRNHLTQEKKWRRYAMLTPCFVTTMHTGPSFFDYYDGEPHPLLNYIDLLIVDEAGQVAPEVSGAMFALAKQALVVGDVKQIEPVWSIIEAVDYGNLVRHHLVQNEDDFSKLNIRGITASSGSVMQMAQQASPYQIPPHDEISYERGMFLAEHRRCVPEIIAYCNELAYNGRLRPMRPSLEKHAWPYLGYVHIKGYSATERGSRKNDREAETVVGWIADNKDKLEKHYQEELEDIIGIITPFSAQKHALFRELKRRGIKLSKVGTVHALQGGERPIVLFSSVYTTRDGSRYFFDRGLNMLNVAVSRAKDSFLVFGDMGIFDPRLDTPSGLLARYLFVNENNEMVSVPVQSRVEIKDETYHIRTLNRHVAALRRAFERAEKRLVIVSPYLRWRAVEADGVCEQVKTAVNRGVQVDIYVDEGFNENLKLPAAGKAASALRASGAKVLVCHNIHSKIVCVDEAVFIEGSFNWLSAERNIPNYTRYETSMIHSGVTASEFIEEVLADIQQRVIA